MTYWTLEATTPCSLSTNPPISMEKPSGRPRPPLHWLSGTPTVHGKSQQWFSEHLVWKQPRKLFNQVSSKHTDGTWTGRHPSQRSCWGTADSEPITVLEIGAFRDILKRWGQTKPHALGQVYFDTPREAELDLTSYRNGLHKFNHVNLKPLQMKCCRSKKRHTTIMTLQFSLKSLSCYTSNFVHYCYCE